MACKWRYLSTTGEILGMGCLPNSFAANELDPTTPNAVAETIAEATRETLNVEMVSHFGDGQKPYRDSSTTWHWA